MFFRTTGSSQDSEADEHASHGVWQTEDWFAVPPAQPAQPAPPAQPAQPAQPKPQPLVTPEELRELLSKFDVDNLVALICPICASQSDEHKVLIPCGHYLCTPCFEKVQEDDDMAQHCPTCRTFTRSTVALPSMSFAWKSDLACNFARGREANEAAPNNVAQQGQRPGDVTWRQDLNQASVDLARRMELGEADTDTDFNLNSSDDDFDMVPNEQGFLFPRPTPVLAAALARHRARLGQARAAAPDAGEADALGEAGRIIDGIIERLDAAPAEQPQAPPAPHDEAPRAQQAEAPRGQQDEAPRAQQAEAPRGQQDEAPRAQQAEAPTAEETEAPPAQQPQPEGPAAEPIPGTSNRGQRRTRGQRGTRGTRGNRGSRGQRGRSQPSSSQPSSSQPSSSQSSSSQATSSQSSRTQPSGSQGNVRITRSYRSRSPAGMNERGSSDEFESE